MRKKKNTITENKTNSFSYVGDITISFLKNNKVCRSVHYKNNGRWPLFKFFSECLAGNYKNAISYRPQYLVLYYANDKGQPIPVISDTEGSIASYTKTENKISSGLIQVVEDPLITLTEDNIGACTVKFHFEIPFSYLSLIESSGDSKWKPINLLTLYCSNFAPVNDNNLKQPSTFCFIPDEHDDTVLGDLLGRLNIDTDQSNYSLRIDWTLSITN